MGGQDEAFGPVTPVPAEWRTLVRERRSDEACENRKCVHRDCWIGEAHVTELTGLLRTGPDGGRLQAWPKTMRVFARRERPHPGAPWLYYT
jgi:hypothetical protein